MDTNAAVDEILMLPADERLRIVEAIWNSIAADPEAIPVTAAQKREIEARLEDFRAYPRTFDIDREACRKAGVDLIFAPTDSEIYPPGDQTRVRPGALADALCGPFRPGHFEGVCTVVAKLFNIVQPDVAYFGQ